MYALNFATCTALDVIQRSVTCHPSLFADRLRSQAETHFSYATTCHRPEIERAARGMSEDCKRAADYAESETVEKFADDLGARVVAFNVACELNLVPRHLRGAMIER